MLHRAQPRGNEARINLFAHAAAGGTLGAQLRRRNRVLHGNGREALLRRRVLPLSRLDRPPRALAVPQLAAPLLE